MSVTIKDVAAAAGTSVSTVSKVINGHYSISEETAERVRSVIRELNYYPSSSAQSFAKGSTKTVTILANLAPNTAFQNPHMFEIIAGLEESLGAKGYRLQLCGVDTANVYEVAEEIISRRGADALAIHISVMTHPLSGLLTKLRFPHIVIGVPNFESQVCWIDNNNVYSGTIAASYLLSQGYRRIAFIGGQYYDIGSSYRLQGVKQEIENAGLQLEDQYIWLGESTRADSFQMTMRLLDQKILPDAIICANNYIAMGCVDALCKRNMKIPQDIGVVAFDDYPFSRMIEPQLTVVDINVRDLGKQAGKLLIDMIKHSNMQVQTYVTTSYIVERQSTMQVNQK
ncbi:MAG: LacI family DNA-binding transcriptional regulator [Eubacteriales bacterium]|nr:LacI family DNA-binding transcriptional regulator [Eubacteriales bacterium]